MPIQPFWLRHLPVSLRRKLECQPNLLNILSNTGWLFFDKVLRMGVGMIVGVWVARYLGPEQFGIFNYASAIIVLFTAVSTLGLNNIVVRDLVRQPAEAGEIVGTALALQVIGGLFACLFAIASVYLLRPEDGVTGLAVAALGIGFLFKATEAIKYWFESIVQAKYLVWIENFAFIVFATIKIILILLKSELMAFVWAATAEAALVAILLIWLYQARGNGLRSWSISLARAMQLLRDSWPLILSGLASMIYMRIDQIMLGQILDNKAVGIYSAALRISEVWYFIPIIISISTFPAIIRAKELDENLYYERLQKLFDVVALLAFLTAILISFSSSHIINLLYGSAYAGADVVLTIHIWAGVFVFLGVASSKWFVIEGLQIYTFHRTFVGCVISIALNYILIPSFGVIGAATSSVIAQLVASVLFNATNSRTRKIFLMQIHAMAGHGLLRLGTDLGKNRS